MELKMKTFKVLYEIEIDAETPIDAALQIEQLITTPLYRPCFTVSAKGTKKEVIDLEKLGHCLT
jgi:hypothetical protein